MARNYLEFEQPLAELDIKIEAMRAAMEGGDAGAAVEINRLEQRARELTQAIYLSLSPWQIAQVARHPQRPYTLDYVLRLFTDFEELHGDRAFADDPAIVAGIGRFNGTSVAVLGHQKGRDVRERLHRNYGMPRPEGYRKALRVMRLAERFRMPVLTFIDTPGAYPGIDAEERGQSEAIARNLEVMSQLRVPIISTVIGEGGSGGALAIGVADRVIMLEFSTYSVISPEGCASILWKSSSKAAEAAEAMGITASRLVELGVADCVVKEPPGGAHRDADAVAVAVAAELRLRLAELRQLDESTLLSRRQSRLRSFGYFQ
ncbi:MAG: acetyl-CoA carboxylase carboxyltransferase subunit alpha [Gammaproteobacteria bacterium]|nr:acetyl-CoA carboxylase carboxyltransferase subunit alpha [Gammaproteobacteria bacterium]